MMVYVMWRLINYSLYYTSVCAALCSSITLNRIQSRGEKNQMRSRDVLINQHYIERDLMYSSGRIAGFIMVLVKKWLRY
jgi:sulfite exporter TauE/SafE